MRKKTVVFLGYDEGVIGPLLQCDIKVLAVVYEQNHEKDFSGQYNELIQKMGGRICTIPKGDNEELIRILKDFDRPDLFVISCFSILSEGSMNIPRIGIINVHPSFLPYYKGPYPIEWALLNGEKRTGLSFMSIDSGVDTGGVYKRFEVEIAEEDDAFTLKSKMDKIVEQNINEIIMGVINGTITATQQEKGGSYYPKRTYYGRFANFKLMTAEDIHNLTRSQVGHGGLLTTYNFKRIAFHLSKLIKDSSEKACGGEVIKINFDGQKGDSIIVQCTRGKVKLYSKRRKLKSLSIGDQLGT
jgi:methionyl-tRNA formyltransferase